MNSAYKSFLRNNGVDPEKISNKVVDMMTLQAEPAPFTKVIKTTGGFIRQLSNKQGGGGPVLPMEYFSGQASGSYYADVPTINLTDATPLVTRPGIPATFQGGATASKSYKFVSVADMKKIDSKATKASTEKVNDALKKCYSRAMKGGGKITQKSLKYSFNEP